MLEHAVAAIEHGAGQVTGIHATTIPWYAALVRWLGLLFVVVACGRVARAPDDGPARIVSLTPSATEVVAGLGATSLLVGVDDYSDVPAEVKALPKVGSFLAPNLEVIVGLRPSLVIVDDIHAQSAGALHDAGITTIECPMHGLPDVKSALRAIGAKLGKTTEAEAAVDKIEAAMAAAVAARPAKRPRVLAVIDREANGLGNLIAAGTGSWVDELLAVTGGENVLAAAGVRYPKISVEEVLRAQPDVILDLSFPSVDGLAPWQGIAVPAVKTGRVVALYDPLLIRPSPRVAEALALLARSLR
jgi:iron complex transport system substrate-binding protein